MFRFALVLLGALPWIALVLAGLDAMGPVEALDAVFDAHCHRDPSRTLTLFGQRLPVCARCTGLYTGVLAGAAFAWPRASLRACTLAAVAGGLVLLLDVGTEALGWRVPALGVRFVTGLAFAYPAALAAVVRRAPESDRTA